MHETPTITIATQEPGNSEAEPRQFTYTSSEAATNHIERARANGLLAWVVCVETVTP